jgi:hypothetical protein
MLAEAWVEAGVEVEGVVVVVVVELVGEMREDRLGKERLRCVSEVASRDIYRCCSR